MKKQNAIQFILLLIGFTLIVFTYFYYPNLNKTETLVEDSFQDDSFKIDDGDKEDALEGDTFTNTLKESDVKKTTTFENVKYEGLYDFDKPFSVVAKDAYITNKDLDLVHMKNMEVILYLSDGRIVKIMSDQGRYNKATFDCFFENNVKATDGQTEIFSNNLDLLATKDFVEIYNDVTLNSPTGSLVADKVDYNFTTKYFKISMFDDSKIKIKVTR